MEEAHNFEILSRKTQRGDQEASEPTSTNWFGSLNDREKFYAITLSKFNGLRYSDFYRIYELVLEVMQVDKRKEEGNEESPVFDFGFSDDGLVDRINAQVKPTEDGTDEFIEFKDDKYAVEVFDIMRRRRSILLKFLPILKQIVERNRQWDIRVRAALAVAEIGKTNFYEVHSQILESWAGDARAYVRATVGYSLAHLARKDKNTREKVESILDSWTIPYWRGSHETWRYPWTVASVYKQIGSIEANWSRPWAYRGLETIAGYADKRLVGAVIHSLIILSRQGQLQDILIILKKWIEEGSKENIKKDTSFQTRSKAGVGAFFILSEIHSQDPSENTNETANDEIQLDSILWTIATRPETEKFDLAINSNGRC